MEKIDRIKGALYGFAIGDAMGATTEFMNQGQIRTTYGWVDDIIGGGWLDLKPGEVTDDTQMSLCVMSALMEGDYQNFKTRVANNFAKWLASDPEDVGNQCYKAIRYYAEEGKYIGNNNSALGNGSLMRALPCALLNDSLSEELNVSQGSITHDNETCSDIIKEYSSLVKLAIRGEEISFPERKLLEPTGYVVNTFNNVLIWAGKDNFEATIIGAVNHGGDADTIAAIAGGLAGARFGYDSIPKKWIDKLNSDVKHELDLFLNFVIKTY